jgi:hypothetical protein
MNYAILFTKFLKRIMMCVLMSTRKRMNRVQYSMCNIVCASARSNPQGNGQMLVSCLINFILT